ncbi:MAG: hypothetical protein HOH33_02240 [Verrucomicrobia bacterium]|jgi:hypothetical protein|nr:hypothetical protein [Verrucomicrobiota bacterium]
MKKRSHNEFGVFFGVVSLFWILGFTGCQTTPKIDWGSRVGQWTYDDVVKDIGPADKRETLSDGSKVAEWLVQKGTTVPRYEVIGYHDDYAYPNYPAYNRSLLRSRYYQGYRSDVHFPDRSVRMVFKPDGTLENVRYFTED